ncbi:MAG: hypothetical protein H0U75_00865 [Legionella sp.]|nr:hypothetical protein [Legionella sp.]
MLNWYSLVHIHLYSSRLELFWSRSCTKIKLLRTRTHADSWHMHSDNLGLLERILVPAVAFNQHFEKLHPPSWKSKLFFLPQPKWMTKVNRHAEMLMKITPSQDILDNANADLKHFIKALKQLQNSDIPEIGLLLNLCKQEFAVQAQSNEHREYVLSWDTLRHIHSQIGLLQKQIQKSFYYHTGFYESLPTNSGRDHADWCHEMDKIIECFHLSMHAEQYQGKQSLNQAHRQANQDLYYLMASIMSTGNIEIYVNKFSELTSLRTLYSTTLEEQLTHFRNEYNKICKLRPQLEELKQEHEGPFDQIDISKATASHERTGEAFDFESASQTALKKINTLIKANLNLTQPPGAISSTFSKILLTTDLNPQTSTTVLKKSDVKSAPTGSLAPLIDRLNPMTNNLLEWSSLESICLYSEPLLEELKMFGAYWFSKHKEAERLIFIKLFTEFNQCVDSANRNDELLTRANQELANIMELFNHSPYLTNFQNDFNWQPFLEIYLGEIQLSLRDVYQGYQQAMVANDKNNQKVVHFTPVIQDNQESKEMPTHFKYSLWQVVPEVLVSKPYQRSLVDITLMVLVCLRAEKIEFLSFEVINTFNTIFSDIHTALTIPPTEPAIAEYSPA